MRPAHTLTASITVALVLLIPAIVTPATALPVPGTENPWLDRRVLNMAHQGGEYEAPSDTLYAFKTAMDKGVDALEMDVHMTKDGHIVVLHDATVTRTTNGAGRVDSLTLDQIKALDAAHWFVEGVGTTHSAAPGAYTWRGVATGDVPPPAGYTANDFTIPTLREIFETFPDVPMNVEIKDGAPNTAGYEKELADLAREFGRDDDLIVVSFIDAYTELFKAYAPEVSTATGTGEAALFWATAQGPAPGSPSPHHALQVPIVFNGVTVVTEDFVANAHANGLAVHVWTVNKRAEMEWLIDIGVDGIMTDLPTLLEEVLVEKGLA